ncbi:MAG: mechanosensitive ion channel family protein [Candidatus Omnitrophica bacterium]|nr:mechanosensitive ion channel family protein [Candidatus Omnitrophota bacterium]MDD5672130.1 mechanosensitive ion channel family protein [Candidatus Omnitrophota bacterium]
MDKEISTLQNIINTVIQYCVNYSFQVLGAIIVLALGFAVANWVSRLLLQLLKKRNLDITLSKFLAGVVRVLILVFAVIIALGKFGITIAPFIAALSAVAFGASFALQGPLANYGAGISIILSRPFVVGDTVLINEISGLVEEVKLACTILTDEDGVKITIPNKKIVGEIVHNSKVNKIVEGVIGISYDSDPVTAIRLITQAVEKFPEVAKIPKPQIGIQRFADSSIDIDYRYWAPTARYFQTMHAVNLAVFQALGKADIRIPFPQRDVHIISQPAQTQA